MADLAQIKIDDVTYDIKDSVARAELNAIVPDQTVRFFFPDLSAGGYSGNCSLIKTPTKAIIMDCGPESDWGAIQVWLEDLYTKNVFTNIDMIIISHYHYDHVDNLESILTNYAHDDCIVYLPMNPTGYNDIPSAVLDNRDTVLSVLSELEVSYIEVAQDTTVQTDSNYVKITLFNSNATDYAYYSSLNSVYNNYSMVALMRVGNVYAMYPGDIQRDAQIRILETHELPRLFLYCVHHHGIQNDDYIPFLETIQPQYSVIMTSHNRALLSAASSYSGNYFSDFVGSTGFSEYEFVCGKDDGTIVKGLDIPRIGWYYSYIDLYVDNTYTGIIHDGTQAHPFTEINEALMFVRQESNLHYYIRVKGTNTKYEYVWVRDFKVPIDILGYKDTSGANVYPSAKGCYLRTCAYVNITNMTFDGTGRDVNSHPTIFYVWASKLSMANCTLDGANLSTSANRYLLQIREGDAYINDCTFKNSDVGIVSYREGKVTTNIAKFDTVSYCINVSNLSLFIRGLDTINNVTNWLGGGGRAVSINNASNIDATLLAKVYKAVISEPFYVSDTYPLCVMRGNKVFAFSSETEVPIS